MSGSFTRWIPFGWLQRISDVAEESSLTVSLLLETNVSGEASKDGVRSDGTQSAWDELCRMPNVHIAGLMTMAPASEESRISEDHFQSPTTTS